MKFESQHLSKTYKTAYRIIPALEDVIFSVMEKEFVCMVGSSECGKTTLHNLIAESMFEIWDFSSLKGKGKIL